MNISKNHLLYSYRRCPYAMRARMALILAGVGCEVYEVNFKNKPPHMLEISPKGTVPVLVSADNQVIDESLDIMNWAFVQNDPESIKINSEHSLISENDGAFKTALDHYKYSDRFPEDDDFQARDQGLNFLIKLNDILSTQNQLISDKMSMVDTCIFPFVRQYANVDREWFDSLNMKYVQKWLTHHLESDLFTHIMMKHKDNPYQLL
jgi:glutathione S-transferase